MYMVNIFQISRWHLVTRHLARASARGPFKVPLYYQKDVYKTTLTWNLKLWWRQVILKGTPIEQNKLTEKTKKKEKVTNLDGHVSYGLRVSYTIEYVCGLCHVSGVELAVHAMPTLTSQHEVTLLRARACRKVLDLLYIRASWLAHLSADMVRSMTSLFIWMNFKKSAVDAGVCT